MGPLGLLILFIGGAFAVGGIFMSSIPAAIAGGLIFIGGSIVLSTAVYIDSK